MIFRILAAFFLIQVFLIQRVRTSLTVEVTLENFIVSKAHNCDLFSACDYKFVFCLDSTRAATSDTSNCAYYRSTTTDLGKGPIYFNTRRVTNPLRFPLPIWPGSFQIKIQVLDQDKSKDDKVDFFFQMVNMEPNREQQYTLTSSAKRATFRLGVRVYCDQNFYGRDCAVQCIPGRTYTCDPQLGKRICYFGWTGEDCLSPTTSSTTTTETSTLETTTSTSTSESTVIIDAITATSSGNRIPRLDDVTTDITPISTQDSDDVTTTTTTLSPEIDESNDDNEGFVEEFDFRTDEKERILALWNHLPMNCFLFLHSDEDENITSSIVEQHIWNLLLESMPSGYKERMDIVNTTFDDRYIDCSGIYQVTWCVEFNNMTSEELVQTREHLRNVTMLRFKESKIYDHCMTATAKEPGYMFVVIVGIILALLIIATATVLIVKRRTVYQRIAILRNGKASYNMDTLKEQEQRDSSASFNNPGYTSLTATSAPGKQQA